MKFIPDDEFDELLDRAEELLNTTHHAFDDSVSGRAVLDAVRAEWNDLPSGAKPEFLAIAGKTLPDGSIHWTGTDTVLGPLIEDGSEIAERFAIRAGTLVTRLIHSDGMVTGVSLRDQLSGHEETIQADAVVVAGDAIRTPQLLWASEIRPQALGRYLSDHPLVFSIVALDERIGKFAELAALQREQESRRERIDPVAAVVRIPFSDGANPFSGQVMYLDKSPIPLPPGMTPSPWGYANVGWGSRKFPRRENGLTFDPTELDYLGFPAVTFEYDMSPQELAEVEEAQRRLRRTAGALGEFIPGGEPRRMPAGASLHYKGTTEDRTRR
ncbi:GMC family oxidoreductase N-terminal domain-containing protein [Arthrobacter sp. SD76]|uniref:GMC family oxidoreductase N-terminal domain-containing protein n=1 Tax=Arthrobacter sp. SD76 TaxID=3415007 RepID=UPI003C769A87